MKALQRIFFLDSMIFMSQYPIFSKCLYIMDIPANQLLTFSNHIDFHLFSYQIFDLCFVFLFPYMLSNICYQIFSIKKNQGTDSCLALLRVPIDRLTHTVRINARHHLSMTYHTSFINVTSSSCGRRTSGARQKRQGS